MIFHFIRMPSGTVHIEAEPGRVPERVRGMTPEQQGVWAMMTQAVWTRCGIVTQGIRGAVGVSHFLDTDLCGRCHRTLTTADEIEAAFASDRENA